MNEIISWLGGESKTVAFAILSGVVGFLAKCVYDLWLARRKDRLERVNQQLKLLYGPLYSLNQSGTMAWAAYRRRVRPGKPFFGSQPPPTQAELESWRLWVRTVFQPTNEAMSKIIENNADLLIEDELHNSLELFLAHVASYKTVVARWETGDFSEHTSLLAFPDELADYLDRSYRFLKNEQRKLLNETAQRSRGA
jgi:hypothetical protein